MKKALIIFAKQPLAGMVKTRLMPFITAADAAELYSCMLLDVLSKVQRLESVARFLFYEDEGDAGSYFSRLAPGMTMLPQAGIDLGERMMTAFQSVFALGYDAAAIIGTDSPDLPLSIIEDAFLALENERTDAVFGPSADGGYYLLAMKRFHASLFQGIEWSRSTVLRMSLARAAQAALRVALLPEWYDLDRVEDLKRPGLIDSRSDATRTRRFIMDRLP